MYDNSGIGAAAAQIGLTPHRRRFHHRFPNSIIDMQRSKPLHMKLEESELYAAKLIEREEYHEAERLLSSLADQGSIYALSALAWIAENGCTGPKDLKGAEYLYEQAISRGNTDAILDLGLLLLKGDRQNEAKIVFERGAELGSLGCTVELGWMLANGTGPGTRKEEGRKMLEEASNRGHVFAQRRLISLDLSDNPNLIKRIGLFGRLLVVAWKAFFEIYRDRRSNKIW